MAKATKTGGSVSVTTAKPIASKSAYEAAVEVLARQFKASGKQRAVYSDAKLTDAGAVVNAVFSDSQSNAGLYRSFQIGISGGATMGVRAVWFWFHGKNTLPTANAVGKAWTASLPEVTA